MKVIVASKNPIKIEAVKEVLNVDPFFLNAEILDVEAKFRLLEQPKSLGETIKGAEIRASTVFNECDYSFGIESGLVDVQTNYANITVCTIYDGVEYYKGLSRAFEVPIDIVNAVIKYKVDINEAAYMLGYTFNKKLGSAEGLIGRLTDEEIIRKDLVKDSIKMALVPLKKKKRNITNFTYIK